MRVKLKPLREQVIVITGASSGLHVFERSLYTRARVNPLKTAMIGGALGAAALLALRRR